MSTRSTLALRIRTEFVRSREFRYLGRTNTKVILASTLGIILSLIVLRVFVSLQSYKSNQIFVQEAILKDEIATTPNMAVATYDPGAKITVKRDFRPLVNSVGNFPLNIQGLDIKDNLSEMSDQGDFLINTFHGAAREQTLLRKNRTRIKVSPLGHQLLTFTNTGALKPSKGIGGNPDRNYQRVSKLTDNRAVRRAFDDDSYLTIDDHMVGYRQYFTLQKEIPSAQPKVYSRADMPIDILERSDQNVIWFRQSKSRRVANEDLLFKMHNDKIEQIAFPEGYKSVDRVCQTGGIIAATFGIPSGKEAIRSFVWQDKNWVELPIPNGFDSAYVQKITFSGVILGCIENSESGQTEAVAWKDHACRLLSSVPNWPASQNPNYIFLANRRGDIVIRERRERVINGTVLLRERNYVVSLTGGGAE